MSQQQQKEKIFAEGFSFKRNENAPDYVIGRISVKVDEAIAFLRNHEKNGWVNLNALYARSGNAYIELDTFEPQRGGTPKVATPPTASAPAPQAAAPEVTEDEEELPF